MPIKGYGVWVGYVLDYQAERNEDDSISPHILLRYSSNSHHSGARFRAAINIKSVSKESRLVFWGIQNFDHPITQFLESLDDGFHPLLSSNEQRLQGKQGLDYIRGNLFDIYKGMLVEHDLPGSNNDILDYVTPTLDRAIAEGAKVFLFGQQFEDKTGIHDIHMNQGNEGKFKKDNGIFQDGGIILQFPDGRFTAIFLAFAIQKVHTDIDGHPITDIDFTQLLTKSLPKKPGALPNSNDGIILIKAALVNPSGPDDIAQGQPETVRLYNGSNLTASLTGWGIINSRGERQELDGSLHSFQEKGFPVRNCPLSNTGDTITLLDSNGLKVDGVKYTAKQAKREGRFLLFHS